MSSLARTIAERRVDEGSLAIYWLSQAGFVFKTSAGKTVYIDPYFSDVVERVFGFKRMMACPILAEDVEADLIVCTHEHLDHMDIDALPIVAKKHRTRFAGPIQCVNEFQRMGIPKERCELLEEGKQIALDGIEVQGVYADHGELTPDALGIVFDFGGIKVYHTGDTAYRPEQFRPAVETHPDILLPCINGRYGNMNAEEAAQLTAAVSPQIAVASDFWMFVEHDGEPARFLEYCTSLAPKVKAMVMKPGEEHLFRKG